MHDHYYSQSPNVKHHPLQVHCHVRGLELTLQSDAGVFSKSGLDFGTRLLIETVDLPEDGMVVDLGCGYGPVGAILSQVYPRTSWILIDINERAVELARENTQRVAERVRVLQGDGLTSLGDERPEAILLNPPIRAGKEVIYRLFKQCAKSLAGQGSLWVVMHKKQGAESASRFLETCFAHVDRAGKRSGYQVFRCSSEFRDSSAGVIV